MGSFGNLVQNFITAIKVKFPQDAKISDSPRLYLRKSNGPNLAILTATFTISPFRNCEADAVYHR